jgi:hypothetical protein
LWFVVVSLLWAADEREGDEVLSICWYEKCVE